jgi:hypothetical protein
MEGGTGTTRMGSRSSTRHGPVSVFQGKVRRWRKSWTPFASPSPSASGSRILLYKWLPLAPPSNANGMSFVVLGFKTNALLFRVHGYIRVALDATLSPSLSLSVSRGVYSMLIIVGFRV